MHTVFFIENTFYDLEGYQLLHVEKTYFIDNEKSFFKIKVRCISN